MTTGNSIQSILYATDFSDNATTALKWAMAISKAHRAPISVLHVAHVPASNPGLALMIQQRIEQSLRTLEEDIRDDGVEVTVRWREGKAWEKISAEAKEHDLVVIGARGHTPLRYFSLGSTADRVLRTAPAPVLTVHDEDGDFKRPPRNVIVPTDFSELASFALDTTSRVFGTPFEDDGKLNITLLHAWQPLIEYGDAYAALSRPNPYVGTEEQATKMLERLAAKISSPSISVTPVLHAGYPAKVIEDSVAAFDADLVAIGTHGHSGLARFMLGSVAERVIHRVRCPVLSVSPAAQENAEQMRAAQRAGVAN